MTVSVLPGLINKRDNFEIIRDQIAAILKLNSDAQRQYADALGEDPDFFSFRTFVEASNPFEDWINPPAPGANYVPIVNVMFDQSSVQAAGSSSVERQKTSGIFNIDCYGYGRSRQTDVGHDPGDRTAAFAAQRAVRLVRNILMAGENTYLQLRGTVWSRMPQSVTMFQPAIDQRAVQNVMAGRISFEVVFNEFSPQVDGPTLEEIGINLIRQPLTGELLTLSDGSNLDLSDGSQLEVGQEERSWLLADYNYTAPNGE